MTTAPSFGRYCFYKVDSDSTVTTFYFKNSTVADALVAGTHYKATYGTKSDNYSW